MSSDLEMKLPNAKEFKASAHRQCFSLPDSLIYYISKNPRLAKIYEKLTHTCKYFPIKNPILIFHCLEIRDDGWAICFDQSKCSRGFCHKKINLNMSNLSNNKLWITNEVRIFSTDSNFSAALISKIYQFDAQSLSLRNQILTVDQFLFYSRNVSVCFLSKTVINSTSCSEIPLEEIIANLPHVTRFSLTFHSNSRNYSYNTVKNLLLIPHFRNINKCKLTRLSQDFDIDTLYEYQKTTEYFADFRLHFNNSLSPTYKKKLDEIVDKELEEFDDTRTAPPLYLNYPGQNPKKPKALFKKIQKFY